MKRLSVVLFAGLLAGSASGQTAGGPTPVAVEAVAIDRFDVKTPVGGAYGALTFLGGLELKSGDRDFGGLSGLRLSPDGSRFTAISDRGNWFRGTIGYEGSRPVSVTGVTRSAIPGRDGKPLAGKRGFDTEALEIEGRTAWVSTERVHWLTRYALGADGRPEGAGKAVALPKAMGGAPKNAGYEAMARLGSGAIVMIAENFLDDAGNNRAFVVGAKAPLTFSVRRADDFSPTDLVRLPSGDLVMVERRYKPPFSLDIRLKRLESKDITAGAVVDGPVLMEASLIQKIDNFEGLGVHGAADGSTVLTLVSDDNFSSLQRTLLIQFAINR